MTLNEINKKIDQETALCIEKKFDWWQFKGRRTYEPQCRSEATQKYQKELNEALAKEQMIDDTIKQKLLNTNRDVIIAVILAVIVLVIFYLFIIK